MHDTTFNRRTSLFLTVLLHYQYPSPLNVSPKAMKSAFYRPDIDGLRAIAVISVLIFHADIGIIPGGFVGVDIFFVISGYLITSIIEKEIGLKTFTFSNFYWRRIKRIFPALFGVIAFTTVVASVILMPLDFKEYGQSLVALSGFASNIYFYVKTDYFAQEATLRPLLHTWSLSVEEQYYLLFPIVLLVLSRWRRNVTIAVLSTLFVASLLASVVVVRSEPSASFYLTWYRGWELLAGSLLAMRIVRPPASKAVAEWVGVAGAALIVFSLFNYSSVTRFPGEAALAPVVGAALLIYSGSGEFLGSVGTLLSRRPVVFIGLISYSLYLYHWPIFVFARYTLGRPLELHESSLLMGLSLLLGYCSWRWIEQPFRHLSADRKKFGFVVASAATSFVVALGLYAHVSAGAPKRLPTDVTTIAAAAMDINPNRKLCDGRSPSQIADHKVCLIGDPTVAPSFVLFGDSFADALSPGVNAAALKAHRRGWVLTQGGCFPLVGIRQINLRDGAGEKAVCREFVQASLAFIAKDKTIDNILLAGRWSAAAEGSRFGANHSGGMYVYDDITTNISDAENKPALARSFARTFDVLKDRKFTLFAYIPEQAINVPRVAALHAYFKATPYTTGVARKLFEARQAGVRKILSDLPSNTQVKVVDLGAELCNELACPATRRDLPIYVDDNHLTRTESVQLLGGLGSKLFQ